MFSKKFEFLKFWVTNPMQCLLFTYYNQNLLTSILFDTSNMDDRINWQKNFRSKAIAIIQGKQLLGDNYL